MAIDETDIIFWESLVARATGLFARLKSGDL